MIKRPKPVRKTVPKLATKAYRVRTGKISRKLSGRKRA